MAIEPDEAGATYREITRAEAWALLDDETRRCLGIDVREFARRYHAGDFDDPEYHLRIAGIAMELESLERNAAADPQPTDRQYLVPSDATAS